VPEAQKQEFLSADAERYRSADGRRWNRCCAPGGREKRKTGREKSVVDFRQVVRECMEAARVRHHLPAEALHYEEASSNGAGDASNWAALKISIPRFSMFLDNAIKYSGENVECGCFWMCPMKNGLF